MYPWRLAISLWERMRQRRNPLFSLAQDPSQYIGGQFEWLDLLDLSKSYAGIKSIIMIDGKLWFNFSWIMEDEHNPVLADAKSSKLDHFPINLSLPAEILRLKSQDGTIYSIFEIDDKVGKFVYSIYPPGKLGVDVEQVKALTQTPQKEKPFTTSS